jgi:hypothetical protein
MGAKMAEARTGAAEIGGVKMAEAKVGAAEMGLARSE